MKIRSTSICLFLLINLANAQQWRSFTNELNVYSLALEHDTIWVGSGGGVSKYLINGTKLATYTKSEGLGDNCVSAVVVDSHGNKWFGNGVYSIQYMEILGSGVTKFDGTNWTKFDTSNSGLLSNAMVPIGADAEGSIWFGELLTSNGWGDGLVKFDGTSWTTFNTGNSGIIGSDAYGMAIDSSGNKWFATSAGLSKYDGSIWTNFPISVISMVVDRLNNVWFTVAPVNMEDPVYILKYDGAQWDTVSSLGGQVSSMAVDTANNILVDESTLDSVKFFIPNIGISRLKYPWPQASVSQIVVDGNNTKWFATNNSPNLGYGIFTLSDSSWTAINAKDSGLNSNVISAAAIDNQNNKWFCGYTNFGGLGGGVCEYNGSWRFYNDSNSIVDFSYIPLNCIKSDRTNNIWLGSENIVYKFDGTNWFTFPLALSLHALNGLQFSGIGVDSNNNIWFSSFGGVVEYLNGTNWALFDTSNSDLPDNNILAVGVDAQNHEWFGTQSHGVCEFDGIHFTNFNPSNSGLTDTSVQAVAIDQHNNKWFGTSQKGLFKFDGFNWVNFNTNNSGIQGDGVRLLYIDEQNNVWAAITSSSDIPIGVSKFDGTNWTNYTTSNSGLTDKEITCIFSDNLTNIWFGTENMGVCELVGGVTAVPEISSTQFSVYPNPSVGTFTIQLPVNQGSYPTEVYNMMGQKIEQLTLSPGQNTIDLSSPPAGMYFVNVQTGGAKIGVKVVVTK